MDFSLLATIALYAVPVVFAITLHEAAHGYVARIFGDQTAWMLGRVTLNPLKHIDPVGTVLVPIGLLLLSKLMGGGGFLFGWAKPVPVNFGNLRHPEARHALGGGGRAGREFRDGARMGLRRRSTRRATAST